MVYFITGTTTTATTATMDNSKSNEPGKVWERPWSIAELKDGSRNWTLASDAGVSLFFYFSLLHINVDVAIS